MAEAPPKPVLAVDLDEVLGCFVEGLIACVNASHGTSNTIADFHSYHFADVWGCSDEESDRRVAAFFESTYFKDMTVVEGAVEGIASLKEAFALVLVTSRQTFLRDVTLAWLAKHFGDTFTDSNVLMGNHYGTGAKRSKPDMCAEVGAVALIDDSLKYATQCAEAGMTSFLFGSYAWNASPADLNPGIQRVRDWGELVPAALAFAGARLGEERA